MGDYMRALFAFTASPVGRWVVVLTWLLALAAVLTLAPRLAEVRVNESAQFLPGDAESTRAAEFASERFTSDSTPAFVVFHRDGGLTEADRAAAEEFATWAASDQAPEGIGAVVSPALVPADAGLVSEDGSTLNVIVALTGDPASDAFADAVEALRTRLDQVDIADLTILTGGPAGLIVDLISVFQQIDAFLLIVTVVLVLVLLVAIYRSPVVAFIPLFAVGVVFQMSDGVAAWVAQTFDLSVNGQATGIMTVVLFGAGTDYTLFVSARFREELERVQDAREAMERTMAGVGGAVASAGGTILIAAGILLFAELRSYQALGPVIAIAVALMMLAALTLIPAILVILGRASYWPFRPRYRPQAATANTEGTSDAGSEGAIYGRVATFVLARPATILAATVLFLGALIGGLALYEPTYDSLEALPSDTESVQAFALLREGFPAGEVAPVEVYVELPDGEQVTSAGGIETVATISRAFGYREEVADVTSPAYPLGLRGPAAADLVASGAPPEALYNGMISADGRVARIDVVLDQNPYTAAALDTIPGFRALANEVAAQVGLAPDDILVGGDPAEAYDTREANNRDSLVILPLVLLSIAIVLGILLRSIVAPIYLAVTIVFTYFSTLGFAVIVFELLGHGGVSSSVPFFLFVFLNALGVDYNIYLMSRIREESRHTSLVEATRNALASTGGVITSAGLILAGTFSALMTLPLQDLFQLGFAVAAGVIIDTFITRTLIVPAVVALLGRWNWWPWRPAPIEGATPAAD